MDMLEVLEKRHSYRGKYAPSPSLSRRIKRLKFKPIKYIIEESLR